MEQFSLDAIGIKNATDKASPQHDYLSFYESFFAPIRADNITILEIGVLEGNSLRTWEEYFPNARIIGVDVVTSCRRFKTDRIEIEIADQSNIQHLNDIARKYGPFDIIIEDGSHRWEHQITTLRTLFPSLQPNGIYIVEDLHTNYGSDMSEKYQGVSSITCVDYLKKWLDLRVADVQIDISKIEDPFLRTYGRAVKHISFYRRACLIKKNWPLPHEPNSKILCDDQLRASSEDVTLLAHISQLGDRSEARGFVNFITRSGRPCELQGLQISTEVDALEYKVQLDDGQWTGWVAEGVFLGTRGESRFLRGVAVRVKSNFRDRCSVRMVCGFKGGQEYMTALDGEEITSGFDSPLCALQIDLAMRP